MILHFQLNCVIYIYNRCIKTYIVMYGERQRENDCFLKTQVILLSLFVILRKLSFYDFNYDLWKTKKEMYNYCHLLLWCSPIMLLLKTTYNVLCRGTVKFHLSIWSWLEERVWKQFKSCLLFLCNNWCLHSRMVILKRSVSSDLPRKLHKKPQAKDAHMNYSYSQKRTFQF